MVYRPAFQPQLPASRCIINGKPLGGLSCSAYGMAMQIDRSTLGKERPSGCEVRRRTGDTTGGLTLPQVAGAALSYGVNISVRTGSNVGRPTLAAAVLRGEGSLTVQIGTKPLLSTPQRATATAINHLVFVNEGRGWNDNGTPDEVLVYDPAADGRDRPYHVDEGPSWWPWSLLLSAAAALEPWGEGDPRGRLGFGKLYMGIGPSTQPEDDLMKLYATGGKTRTFAKGTPTFEEPGGAQTGTITDDRAVFKLAAKDKADKPSFYLLDGGGEDGVMRWVRA